MMTDKDAKELIDKKLEALFDYLDLEWEYEYFDEMVVGFTIQKKGGSDEG